MFWKIWKYLGFSSGDHLIVVSAVHRNKLWQVQGGKITRQTFNSHIQFNFLNSILIFKHKFVLGCVPIVIFVLIRPYDPVSVMGGNSRQNVFENKKWWLQRCHSWLFWFYRFLTSVVLSSLCLIELDIDPKRGLHPCMIILTPSQPYALREIH